MVNTGNARLNSPCLIMSPPPTGQCRIQTRAKRSLRFSAADPGQSSASWQQRPESNQSSQALFSRATIRFVVFLLQTWCWAIRQPRLHPAMSSLRNYPHYTHSSQSAGYAGNQNPIFKPYQRRTKTPARMAYIVSLTFLPAHSHICSSAFGMIVLCLSFCGTKLRKHLRAGIRRGEQSHAEHEKCWVNKAGRRKG